MSQILPFLFLGGKDESRSLDFLERHCIQTIINMTPPKSVDPAGVPNYHEDNRQFRYHRFSLVDTMAENIIPTLKQAVELIERSRHYGNVLVHCRQGVSRSAAIVAAYLIRYRGMSLSSALAFLRKRRPVVRPNEAFLAQLERYEADVAELRRLGGVVPHEGDAAERPAPAAALAGSKRSARESSEEAAKPLERLVRPRGGGPGPRLDDAPGRAAAGHGAPGDVAAAPVDRTALCEECGEAAAAVRCRSCDVAYCVSCDADVHSVESIGDHKAARATIAPRGGRAGSPSGSSAGDAASEDGVGCSESPESAAVHGPLEAAPLAVAAEPTKAA